MTDGSRLWSRWWVELCALALLAVPAVALVVAGVVELRRRGWLLWWTAAAAGVALVAWGALRLRHGRARRAPTPPSDEPALTAPDATWAPHDLAAWEAVRARSGAADGSMLVHRRHMLDAARETVELVAAHYHPGQATPALEFTLPELLLLTERVSARLRLVLLEEVPLSQRLKARHLVRAWGYRPLFEAGLAHGRKAYVVARLARAVNPLQALVAEVRDRLMDDLFENVQTNVRRRIARLWVEEVGRAAIELYSGRLRVDAATLASAAEAEGLDGVAAAAAPPAPLRLLVAGRTKAGKSTLVNALLGDLGGAAAATDALPLTSGFEGYELRQEGMPPAYLVDSPGIESDAGVTELVDRALACDLVVWVVPAHRADRALDRRALDALRERFAAEPQRKMPPLVVVASHVDRLSPPREWAPPYNVETPSVPKARSIRAALEAIAADLSLPIDAVVPMRLDAAPPYNLDLLWLRLEAVLEDAQRARWVRVLHNAVAQSRWRSSWRQLAGAGRMVGWLVKG